MVRHSYGICSLHLLLYKLIPCPRNVHFAQHITSRSLFMDSRRVCAPQIPLPRWRAVATRQSICHCSPFPDARDPSRLPHGQVQASVPRGSRLRHHYSHVPTPNQTPCKSTLPGGPYVRHLDRIHRLWSDPLLLASLVTQGRILQELEGVPYATSL